MQAIAMIYSIVAAVCVLDVVSARREQRASFALAYRQARGGRETGVLQRIETRGRGRDAWETGYVEGGADGLGGVEGHARGQKGARAKVGSGGRIESG